MKFRVVTFADLNASDVYDVARLRQDVFVVEQECPYRDLDGYDTEPNTGHVLLRDGDTLLGYARVLDEISECRIGRVALAPHGRGRGLADGLIKTALEYCATIAPASDVVLDAQSPLARWYAGFGFVVDGEEFLEDGIPHTPMRLSR